MTISIDFDGTITDGFFFPDTGPVMDWAPMVIKGWHDDGNTIILNTCRSGRHLQDAIAYLGEHGIPVDYVNENIPTAVRAFNNDPRKVCADLYIDDRGLGWIPDWLQMDYVVRHHPLYTKKEEQTWDGEPISQPR